MNCRRKSLIIFESCDFLILPGEIFLREEKSFPREKIYAQYPAEKKRKHAIFAWFQNWRRKSLENISIQKFFFFWKKYIFEIFSPDFGTSQKFHVFVFSLLGFYGVLLGGCRDRRLFHLYKGLSGKKSF